MEASRTAYLAWKDKLAIELKGSDLNDYNYIWDGISISPFEERKGNIINYFPRNKKGWLIGAHCEFTNESIRHALKYGAEIISLDIESYHSKMDILFKDIRLDWIGLEVCGTDTHSISTLYKFLKKQKFENTGGSVFVNSDEQYKLYSFYSTLLPNYKFLSVECTAADTRSDLAIKFTTLIQNIELLSVLDTVPHILSNVTIRFIPGNDLVLNISMIRALRLVWMHVLKSFNQDVSIPITIHAHIKNNGIKPTDNMIISSASSVACIAAGSDALFIEAPDHAKSYKAWHVKLQHIMKEESKFDEVEDPIAGAFLIERMSTIIAEKIWERI